MLRLLPLALLVAGCNLDNPGVDPPPATLNFPIAIDLDPVADVVYVANSNFDLRYNGGSVQSYGLEELATALPAGSEDVVVDPATVIRSEVVIGAHVSGMARSPDGNRLYLSVRSDSNLTFINTRGGVLACDQTGNPGRCSEAFRRGDEAVASERNEAVPVDPTGVAAGPLSQFDPALSGDFVLMSHRGGQVSFFLSRNEGDATAPVLVSVLGGLPENLINIQFDPETQLGWVPSASEARIGLVGLAIDPSANPLRSFAFNAGAAVVAGVNDGSDTRDVVFDSSSGERRAYVLARSPEAVLAVNLERSNPGSLFVERTIPVGFGPSRLALAQIDVGGSPRTFVFASCFDSRDVWIIDPRLGQAVTVIRGMSGPFELAVDEVRRRVYITDFRSSVIRVADLAPAIACLEGDYSGETCEPPILGSIGEPRPVGELL